MFSAYIHTLCRELEKNLPGALAQQKMSPSVRISGRGYFSNKFPARNSGVLILLYPKGSGVSTILMERTIYKGVHSGQISLPGGKHEKGDADLIATALRESQEEIGVEPADVQVIGKLTPLFVPVSNFKILPVVGYVNYHPVFVPDPKEVNQLIEVDLADLFNPSCSKVEDLLRDNYRIAAPYFEIGKYHVWGATAMILSELREIICNASLSSI